MKSKELYARWICFPTHFSAARDNKNIWCKLQNTLLFSAASVNTEWNINCVHTKPEQHVTVVVFITRQHCSVSVQTSVTQLLTEPKCSLCHAENYSLLACLCRELPEETCKGMKSCKNSLVLSGSGMGREWERGKECKWEAPSMFPVLAKSEEKEGASHHEI